MQVKVQGVFEPEKEISQGEYPNHFCVVLEDKDGRQMAVWMGMCEAFAISYVMQKTSGPQQDMIHDLFIHTVSLTGAQLSEFRIIGIMDGVFQATMRLSTDASVQDIGIRTSDLIALSLRANLPIYVDDELWEKASEKPQVI